MATNTGSRKYSKKESFNRILRILEGAPAATDQPETLMGDVLSEDSALSDIAELLAGSLPSQSGMTPPGMVEPYGGIWTWTGTCTMTNITADVFTKITGSFQNSALYNGVTCQPTQDRVLITGDGGNFEVTWQASILGSPDITYWIEPYNHGVGIPQAVARAKPYASGSAVSLSGHGFTYVTGTSQLIDLRVRPTATAWFILDAAQLTVRRVDPMS